MAWVVDLDGVIWLADQPIPGSAEAVAALRQRGVRLVFVTNNSSLRVADYVAKLAGMGVDAAPEDVLTSAQAAASLLEPGTSAVVCGGPGVTEALEERGVEPRRDGPADAVVVGWHRDFDFARLTAAATAARAGARLIGTNQDATYPTPDGLLPGAGSILAAVEVAAGVEATVAGKPHPPIIELLRQRAGPIELVVGDRLDTDGALARALDAPFGLVLSGVTRQAPEGSDQRPAHVAVDLRALAAQIEPAPR
ncbi:MAG TPA: HAD-IIA family hydrolase [Acidimicrobiales bacterium]|nr:HAD-IIA family hydrolase [Acidimicrobiales bacterium]